MKRLSEALVARASVLPAIALAVIACSLPAAEQSRDRGAGGGMADRMMMRGGMMAGGTEDMRTIHGLLASHRRIERRVENLPDGVRTITTSDDPHVGELIRAHVRQMRDRYQRGQPIRAMDPLFRELFEHRHKARLEVRDVSGGVEVVHTSSDPQVAQLIRQHAHHFVGRVVERGMAGAMGHVPLPEGYRGTR